MGEQFRGLVGDVDADLCHCLHRGRIDAGARVTARGADLDGIAGQVAQEACRHLGTAGVVDADEQHTWARSHGSLTFQGCGLWRAGVETVTQRQ